MLIKPFVAYCWEDKDKKDQREVAVVSFYFNRNSRWYKVIGSNGKFNSMTEKDFENQYRWLRWL